MPLKACMIDRLALTCQYWATMLICCPGLQSLPIWASLSKGKTELYRDIQAVFLGNSPVLEE